MSFSVTASLLTGSRNLIESVTNERNDNEITLIQFFLNIFTTDQNDHEFKTDKHRNQK